MNIALWMGQGVLAAMFFMAGTMKATRSKGQLVETMAWVESFTAGTVRLIGLLEVGGALGLIVPAVTGVLPWLTPLAAIGLALTMIGAIITHIRRKEYGIVGFPFLLFALATWVAYGRLVLLPL